VPTAGAAESGGRGAAGADIAAAADGGSGGAAARSCTAPPEAGPLLGWASVMGSAATGAAVATTTGGGAATPLTVSTLAALNAAVSGSTPAVVYVKGVLAAGTLKVGSNKTIAGVCGAEIHGHVDMNGSANVIFRNLKVVGYNCSDNMSECKSGFDAITVVSSAHHLWFDHDDISDGSDGNLDITNGSDFVTVSWTKFWYSSKRTDPVTGTTGHRFSNLIGAADGVAVYREWERLLHQLGESLVAVGRKQRLHGRSEPAARRCGRQHARSRQHFSGHQRRDHVEGHGLYPTVCTYARPDREPGRHNHARGRATVSVAGT
jgi:hypothetical protein